MGRELGREVYFDGRNMRQFPIDEDVYYSTKIGFQDFAYEESIKSLSNISHPFLRLKATWLHVYRYFHPKYQNEIRQLFTCSRSIMKQK
uniref:Uncharacterized protein n=1 Tax=Acrobeloides nanus TaxID=290746 RepID=A0A914E5M3_9BILA